MIFSYKLGIRHLFVVAFAGLLALVAGSRTDDAEGDGESQLPQYFQDKCDLEKVTTTSVMTMVNARLLTGSDSLAPFLRAYPGKRLPGVEKMVSTYQMQFRAAWYIVEGSVRGLSYADKRGFLEDIIFRLGHSFKREKENRIRARLKNLAKNRRNLTEADSLPDWPELFLHPLLRDAFTCCANVLTAEEITALLVTCRTIYFPLLVCNYEFASGINTWPTISEQDLGLVFDLSDARVNPGTIEPGQHVTSGSVDGKRRNLMCERIDTVCTSSLNLPPFKLPRFLQEAPLAIIKRLLDAYKYDLRPIELEVLLHSRGGLDELFAELCDNPRAWFLLKTAVLRFHTMNFDKASPTSDVDNIDICNTSAQGPGAQASGSPARRECCLPPPLPSIPSYFASLAYFADVEPLLSAIELAKRKKAEVMALIVPCMHQIIACELAVRCICFALKAFVKPNLSKRSIIGREWLELELEMVLCNRYKLVSCISSHPFLRPVFSNYLFYPLSSQLRFALFHHLGLNDKYVPDLGLVQVFKHFVDRDLSSSDVRLRSLALYASPFADSAAPTLIEIFSAWNELFKESGLIMKFSMLSAVLFIFDDDVRTGNDAELANRQNMTCAKADLEEGNVAAKLGFHAQDCEYFDVGKKLISEYPTLYTLFDNQEFGILRNTAFQSPRYTQEGVLHLDVVNQLVEHLEVINIGTAVIENYQAIEVINLTIFRGCMDELGLGRIRVDNSETFLELCPAMLIRQLQFLRGIVEVVEVGPLLTLAQTMALNNCQNPAVDCLMKSAAFTAGLKNLSAVDLNRHQLSLDFHLYAMHTVSDSDVIDYLDRRNWILNNPELFLLGCNSQLWHDQAFRSRVWEIPFAACLPFLDTDRINSIDLVQCLIEEPLVRNITAAPVGSYADIRSIIWTMLKYLIMQDYAVEVLKYLEYILKACSAQNRIVIRPHYLSYYMRELSIRSQILSVLEVIDTARIFKSDGMDEAAAQLKSDFDWICCESNWGELVSLGRINYAKDCMCNQFRLEKFSESVPSDRFAEVVFSNSMLHSPENTALYKGTIDRAFEMIDRYAPTIGEAHVWSCRWKVAHVAGIANTPVTRDTKLIDLDMPPKWLTSAEKCGTLPGFEITIAKHVVRRACAKLLSCIQQASR